MDSGSRIYVVGHGGLVGSAILRRLRAEGATSLITAEREQLDLTRQADVEAWFATHKPEYVFLAAARVGGILANAERGAEFIRDNLLIQTNVIDAAHRFGCRKLLFLGSSCIYPKHAPQPMREDHLMTGPLEPTNAPYAVAKIAGIHTAQAYHAQFGMNAISLMPTNLYGPGDNFHPRHAHVLPALIRRFHEAKLEGAAAVTVWGSGAPRREFLHVDDLADAAVFLMRRYEDPSIINVGTGADISIRELAELIRDVVGFDGEIAFDPSKPDGTPRKLLDVSRLHALGWRARTPLRDGIAGTYRWFQANAAALRG